MHWTNEKPTSPGWYWWREHRDSAPVVVYVYRGSAGLFVHLDTGELRKLENDSIHGQWAGPISEPMEE